MIGYRPEIDGLRALAVIPVVFYHAGFPGFEGGYIGVDVFFVISGYLITSLILGEIAENNFSFLNFYERRARRILPALFVVTIISIPFSWMLMTPQEYKSFANSTTAVALFASNFYFWWESGYFDTAIELKPLIHTWSLAVEEQYYLIFPVLLLSASRFGRGYIHWFLWLILIFSLALAERSSMLHPDASFYLLPSRGWELMVGALLATNEETKHNRDNLLMANILPGVGLCLIAISLYIFNQNSVHPGLLTLVPVAGTALIIRFGHADGMVQNLLRLRSIVWLGLISYSLYLWHQPVFAFARLSSLNHLSWGYYVLLILLSFILATITWKYVESPFRNRTIVHSKSVWILSGSIIPLVLVIGLAGSLMDFRPGTGEMVESAVNDAKSKVLFVKDGTPCHGRLPTAACVVGSENIPVSWAIVGDSHAGALGSSFDKLLQEKSIAGIQLTSNGCPYAPDLVRIDNGDCLERNRLIKDRLNENDIKVIVLVGRYVLQLEKNRFDNREGGIELGQPAGYTLSGTVLTETERRRVVASSYQYSVQRLLQRGKKVVLVYPIPEVGWNVPRMLILQSKRKILEPLTTDLKVYRSRTAAVFEAFDGITDNHNLLRIYPDRLFCDSIVKNRCATTNETTIFYFDDDHLSVAGANLLVADIFDKVTEKWGER